ncbi:MAG TPA: isomerizing glutamine--fructose-6-phosphate transaminase [Terriglobales bacterium]|nr:isomerizing glutamine--fructose-6-phosphate transaminase [Terriglobales bacterium]
MSTVQVATEGKAVADKAGFAHFMLKEIFENGRAVRDTVLDRISRDTRKITLEGMKITPEEFRALKKINIIASGTSRHAGLAGRIMIKELAGVPVDVDHASEFEYSDPMTGPNELTILITQSGETADTIGALHEARRKGSKTLAISNVVGATITREADAVIYTHAGAEIAIASTKAYTAQLAALFLFSVYLGEVRGALSPEQARKHIDELLAIPEKIDEVLKHNQACEDIAERNFLANDFLFLARGVHFPIALDGALKLKETSYIHAEGYPAGEVKHGPYALIDATMPVVFLAAKDDSDAGSVLRYEKTIQNMKDVRERLGRVIAVATEGDTEVEKITNQVVFVPKAPELLLPLLEIVPLQLMAYHIACRRGVNVDNPRNLVKSVTVE